RHPGRAHAPRPAWRRARSHERDGRAVRQWPAGGPHQRGAEPRGPAPPGPDDRTTGRVREEAMSHTITTITSVTVAALLGLAGCGTKAESPPPAPSVAARSAPTA